MRQPTSRLHCRTRQPNLRNAVSTAAAALLLALPTMVAHAQFYSVGGAVGSYPGDAFAGFDANVALFDTPANTLSIGGGAAGSFSMLAGAHLIAAGLTYGDGLGSGSGTIDGSTTLVQLGGNVNRLQVGNWGAGNLTVSGGALIDSTLNLASCLPGSVCGGNFVGNAAGSTGVLTLTGTNTELRSGKFLGVGQTAVFTLAHDGFDFGTPGGTTNGTVDVLAGATLKTGRSWIGVGPNNGAALGTEVGNGTVTISGANSRWVVNHDAVANIAAFVSVGSNANGNGALTISGGGQLLIDGTAGPGPNDGINIGQNNGVGTVTVTGTDSKLTVLGHDTVIQVGRSGAAGSGSFSLLAGGNASALWLNVGRDASTGTTKVDGDGSVLTLSGASSNAGSGSAFASVGWSGTGRVEVVNKGVLTITDGGANTVTAGGSPGFIVGRGAGGHGDLTIDGSGSKLQVVSTSLGPPVGVADNFNPYTVLGQDPGSVGQLTISNGGQMVLTGNAISTTTNGRATTFNVGGSSDSGLGGNGTATVKGSGSELRVEGSDGFIAVGRNGTGTLSLSDHASVATTIINVGRAASGDGTLLVDASQITLTGQQTGNNLSGAGMSIGNRGGTGRATIAGGSVVSITNPGSSGASFNLGGTGPNPLGTGELTLSGGSQILIDAAAGLATFNVGRDGTGTATITGASLVNIGDGTTYVGRLAGGSGGLRIDSGSTWLAGVVSIGGGSDTVAGGTGTVEVVGTGTLLSATNGASRFIGVGRLAGNGTLSVSDRATVASTLMAVGRGAGSHGTLNLDQAAVELTGQQASFGAGLAIGHRGGTGIVNLTNGSSLTLTNAGNLGVDLRVGGSISGPGGTGTLNVSGGSQVKLIGNPGVTAATIGHDGTGTATFSGGSALDAPGGDVIIAGEPGSTGTLTLNSGSTLDADYVGVGSKRGGIDGGVGRLYINDSTVNATTVEIGSLSKVGGNNGLINGHVVVRGELSPGNSPGRLTINGALTIDGPGRLTIDIGANADGSYSFDELVLTQGTTFDLQTLQVNFNFLGDTDPNAFAGTGQLTMDTFIRSRSTNGTESGLSTVFGQNQDWGTVLSAATFTATSSDFTVDLDPNPNGTFTVHATPVPEPDTWLLWMCGAALLGTLRRRGLRPVTA